MELGGHRFSMATATCACGVSAFGWLGNGGAPCPLASEVMDNEKAPESFGAQVARIAYALNGIPVQKPDGSTALVGEQLGVDARPRNADGSLYSGQTFMYGEQGDEPMPPTWEQITAALSRLGMVPVARSWYHEARVLMDARPLANPGGGVGFPSNALRSLHGEKWR